MNDKIEELNALLEQEEANLTEYGKKRIKILQDELLDKNNRKA